MANKLEGLSVWEALHEWAESICRPYANTIPPQYLIDAIKALESTPKAAPEPELEMAIGYALDSEPPETLAGCYARISNMQRIIRQLVPLYAAAPINAIPREGQERE